MLPPFPRLTAFIKCKTVSTFYENPWENIPIFHKNGIKSYLRVFCFQIQLPLVVDIPYTKYNTEIHCIRVILNKIQYLTFLD